MKEISYREMEKRIQEKRLSLKLTQEKLAEMIDVSSSYISEIERGSSIYSLQVLVNIAEILNANLDFLVNDINNKSESDIKNWFKYDNIDNAYLANIIDGSFDK